MTTGEPASLPTGDGARLRVDVWSDVACPWCWIGHARLRRALLDEEPDSVQVVHRAFELSPGLPPAGLPADEVVAATYGSADAARDAMARVTREGAGEGVAMRFDLVRRAPNTRLAHRLVKVASHVRGTDAGLDALEALFSAHLREGRDVADPETAVRVVARAAGLSEEALRVAADEGAGEPEVQADQDLAARLEIRAVPYFVADGRVALGGAHEPALLGKLLEAGRRRPAA